MDELSEAERERERLLLHRVLHLLNEDADANNGERVGAVMLVTIRAHVGANLTTILAHHVPEEEHVAIGYALSSCLRQAAEMTDRAMSTAGGVLEVDVNENGEPTSQPVPPSPKGQVH